MKLPKLTQRCPNCQGFIVPSTQKCGSCGNPANQIIPEHKGRENQGFDAECDKCRKIVRMPPSKAGRVSLNGYRCNQCRKKRTKPYMKQGHEFQKDSKILIKCDTQGKDCVGEKYIYPSQIEQYSLPYRCRPCRKVNSKNQRGYQNRGKKREGK